MFRLNRSRFLGIFCVLVFVYFLVFTDSGSSVGDFRANTEAGLLRKAQREQDLPLRGRLSDEDLTKKTNEELQGILASQSIEKMGVDENGVPTGRTHHDADKTIKEKDGYGSRSQKEVTTTTRSSYRTEESKSIGSRAKYPKVPDTEKTLKTDDEDPESDEDPGKDFARVKLMEYLKNPVVIFSKTFCPHSKRAKQLLLEVYNIVPKPLVVELDMLGEKVPTADGKPGTVSLGRALQDLLAEVTSRRTVPNIVVGGHHSIGGNDKIWELHEVGSLADDIKKYGGIKIISVDINESEKEFMMRTDSPDPSSTPSLIVELETQKDTSFLYRLRPTLEKTSLKDIPSEYLRLRTLRILRTIPTTDVATAYKTLIAFKFNVEAASWHILEQQYQTDDDHLPLNEFVDLVTRSCVMRLQAMNRKSSTQDCYVAVKVSRGIMDDAMKHLIWMQEQRKRHGGGTGFLVDPDWMPDIVQ